MAGARRVNSKADPDLIVWGSSALTSVLFEQGLVDEVVLIVYREWARQRRHRHHTGFGNRP
jgi:hypothetical protein